MSAYLSHFMGDDHLVVSAERTLFWENTSTLVVADLHIGKTGHFRKAGIAIPQSVYKDDLHRLIAQILFFKAERLVIVGDLTHSVFNKEIDLFKKWRRDFSLLDVHLVKGNHDILQESWYQDANITVSKGFLKLNNYHFVHDIADAEDLSLQGYIFSGHVHPGICLRGRGRQSLRFPCFYFSKSYCVLPAFSRFTGTYEVEPDKDETAFAIMGKEIIKV